jgi:hypothetical protein
MFGRFLLAAGGRLRAVVLRVLPAWRTVRRLARRLLRAGLVAAGFGVQSVAGVAAAGPAAAGSLHPGIAAVGFACLGLAAAVPAAYLLVVFTTATGSLLGRRIIALGRAVNAVGRRRDHGDGRGRAR